MNTIVFTFGRMNPPTVGHQRLVSKVLEIAKQVNGNHIIYLSQRQKCPTDPLTWQFKRRICEASFPGVNISKDESIKTPFHALESFKGIYEKVILVVGEDQLSEFTCRMAPYAADWGMEFEVISAGQRLVESIGVEGISATKLRQYAIDNNREAFYVGLPARLSPDIKSLVFENTRIGLKC